MPSIEASGAGVCASRQQWIQLIQGIKALRTDTFDIADRLRSWRIA